MNIYRPVEAPQPATQGEARCRVPIPESIWNEGEIGRGVEHALRMDSAAVLELSKLLEVHGLAPLENVWACVRFQYQMPPAVYVPGCMDEIEMTENKALKNFVYAAQTALQERFDSAWFIAPYFTNEDDTQEFVNLGVFIDENFLETVVE